MRDRSHLMEKVDSDEIKLFETRKHAVGIIVLYVQALIGMILAIGLSYFLIPLVIGDTDFAFTIANIFTAAAILMSFVILTIATIIYKENRLIVTDRNITQVLQDGIFSRKVSQLNLHNVEDVTARQNGLLQTIFNFGTIVIETAGEQTNFVFTYCPNPDYYAKLILEAREKMLGQRQFENEDILMTEQDISKSPLPQKSAPPSVSAMKDMGAETIKQAISEK